MTVDMLQDTAFLPPHELPTGVLVWWVGLWAGRKLEPSGAADLNRLCLELTVRSTHFPPRAGYP